MVFTCTKSEQAIATELKDKTYTVLYITAENSYISKTYLIAV